MDKLSMTNQSSNLDDLGERIFFQALSGSTRELAVVFSNLISDLYLKIDTLEQDIQSLKK